MARFSPSSRAPAAALLLLGLTSALLVLLAAPAPAVASNILVFGDGVCVSKIGRGGLAAITGGANAQCTAKVAKSKKGKKGHSHSHGKGKGKGGGDGGAQDRPPVDVNFDLPDGVTSPPPPPDGGAPAITFTVVPEGDSDTASPKGAYFSVSWNGVTDPRKSDRIAVLIGAQDQSKPDSTLHPRSYLFVTDVAEATWAQGSGTARIYLPLLREPVTVSYVRRDTSDDNWNANICKFKSLAQVVIKPPTSDPPHNVHLSLVPTPVGAPVKAAAIWQQRSTISGASVKWRSEAGAYGDADSGTAAATASTFTPAQLCTDPAKKAGYISPGQIYRGDIVGLANNARYFYQVGSDAAGWSEERSFLTPPSADDGAATMRMLITADSGMYTPDYSRVPNGNTFAAQLLFRGSVMTPNTAPFTVVQAIAQAAGLGPGQQPGSKGVVDAMEQVLSGSHLVVNNGDISYARGEGHQRDLWGAQFGEQVSSKAITMYSVGNHEADSERYPDSPESKVTSIDSGGECNVPTRRLFQMPQPSGATSDWFSANVGFVHFIQLNSEQYLNAGSKQRAWLEADLKAVDRARTPWLVVGLHRPVLVDSNDGGDQKSATSIRQAIEPLLVKYQVDVVLAGHIHAAQRSCVGVIKGTCVGLNDDGTAKAPLHVLTGHGGYQSPLGAFQQVPAWEEFATWEFGYTEALVTRTSFTLNTLTIAGNQVDTITLTKPGGWTPNPAAAEALYASTAAWVVPETIDLAGLTAALSVNFIAAALLNDDWSTKYLQPGTEFWSIINGLPGKDGNDWTIQQVWQVVYPVYELINTGVFSWLSPILTQDVKYIWQLISPGGRMYYGP